jgi:Zn-finger nucleic acid-binding protein
VIDHWPGLHCNSCRGVLIGQEHSRIIIEYRRARASGPPDPPRPLNRADLRRKLHCPRCRRTMQTHPYYGPGNFVIDSCPHCRFVWLDHGELNTATRAPGRDRGKRRSQPA